MRVTGAGEQARVTQRQGTGLAPSADLGGDEEEGTGGLGPTGSEVDIQTVADHSLTPSPPRHPGH